MFDITSTPRDRPVLIAGPTASGKSALALEIAAHTGGAIVKADAQHVYDGWRVLTARPDDADLAQAPHHLYGHVPFTGAYSVGHWLRDLTPYLAQNPIIVGGTGLYFNALTRGLAPIPPTPPEIRATADALPTDTLLNALDWEDPDLAQRIDRSNRARIQRGWEVLRATGKPLSAWQDQTPPPLLPLDRCTPLVLMPDRDWLNTRIAQRFDQMLDAGALAEAAHNLPRWHLAGGARKAIGAPELIAHLRDETTLDAAREAAVTASRQYAKRQRSWFRSNMADWQQIAF